MQREKERHKDICLALERGNDGKECLHLHRFLQILSTFEIPIVDFEFPKFATLFATGRHVSAEVGASNLGKHGISRYESSGKGSGGWKYPAEVPVSGTSCWTHEHMLQRKKSGPMLILRYP